MHHGLLRLRVALLLQPRTHSLHVAYHYAAASIGIFECIVSFFAAVSHVSWKLRSPAWNAGIVALVCRLLVAMRRLFFLTLLTLLRVCLTLLGTARRSSLSVPPISAPISSWCCSTEQLVDISLSRRPRRSRGWLCRGQVVLVARRI